MFELRRKVKFVHFTGPSKGKLFLDFDFGFFAETHLNDSAPQTFNQLYIAKVKVNLRILSSGVENFLIVKVCNVFNTAESTHLWFVYARADLQDFLGDFALVLEAVNDVAYLINYLCRI